MTKFPITKSKKFFEINLENQEKFYYSLARVFAYPRKPCPIPVPSGQNGSSRLSPTKPRQTYDIELHVQSSDIYPKFRIPRIDY